MFTHPITLIFSDNQDNRVNQVQEIPKAASFNPFKAALLGRGKS
jgi:hypothetical protein